MCLVYQDNVLISMLSRNTANSFVPCHECLFRRKSPLGPQLLVLVSKAALIVTLIEVLKAPPRASLKVSFILFGESGQPNPQDVSICMRQHLSIGYSGGKKRPVFLFYFYVHLLCTLLLFIICTFIGKDFVQKKTD